MSGVNWKAICQTLEAVEPERTEEGFLNRSLEQLETLVPADTSFGCLARAICLTSAR